MNNKQLAHIWAQQRRDSGKGSSFYFEGTTIYSYGRHFPIARFTEDAHGKKCVLFTTRGYSNSTAKHINYTRAALHGLDIPCFYVNDPSSTPGISEAETLKKRAFESIVLAGRARSRKESLLNQARSYEAQFFALCRAFKIKHEDARKKTIISPAQVKELQAAAAVEEKKAAAQRAKQAAAREKEIKLARADWMNGKENSVPYYAAEPVMLRIKGEELQTSRGAVVPLEAARALFARAEKTSPEAVAAETPKIGEFRVNRMEGGSVIIGCHSVPYAEIKRVFTA